MFSLDNKVALVTGSSRGLGAGIAHTLARAGADKSSFMISNHINHCSTGKMACQIPGQKNRLMSQHETAPQYKLVKVYSVCASYRSQKTLVSNSSPPIALEAAT